METMLVNKARSDSAIIIEMLERYFEADAISFGDSELAHGTLLRR
jgi:hypothetical protein